MNFTETSAIFALLCTLFSTHTTIERNEFMENLKEKNLTTREAIEKAIRDKAEAPETTAAELEQLAHAYSELSRADGLLNMWSNMPGFNGSQSSTPPQNPPVLGSADCVRDPF